jgi:formate dehydrogenase major subunit/formate dehydrogenase alpha subunit
VLASGKCLNEENYLLNKLVRQVLGSNHIDCGSHAHFSSVVDGLEETVGLTAMSNSFDDIAQQARSLLVIGSNLTEQHPVFGARLRQAILRRKLKMIVASPDFVNIAEYAALPLYHRPSTEAALVKGLMHIILEKGWADENVIAQHQLGFAGFKAALDAYTPARVSEMTGLSEDALYQAAEILASNRPTAVIWSVGLADPVTGRDSVRSLANLQMLLGNLDVSGGGVNPLRSQNNIQGACDVGALPGMLPGYQKVSDADARRKFEQAWGVSLPGEAGLDAARMLAAAGRGEIKALYIINDDIVGAADNGIGTRRSLEACELIVLQEILPSDTTRYADVLLPGVSFAEKSGTFTSAERRIQMVQQAISPVGQARPDWQIIDGLAQRLLKSGQTPEKAEYAAWGYASAEQIMREIAALTPIYAGVTHTLLAKGERVQWPVGADGQGAPRLEVGMFAGK